LASRAEYGGAALDKHLCERFVAEGALLAGLAIDLVLSGVVAARFIQEAIGGHRGAARFNGPAEYINYDFMQFRRFPRG